MTKFFLLSLQKEAKVLKLRKVGIVPGILGGGVVSIRSRIGTVSFNELRMIIFRDDGRNAIFWTEDFIKLRMIILGRLSAHGNLV